MGANTNGGSVGDAHHLEAWPSYFGAKTVYLTSLQAVDAPDLYPLLHNAPENVRLFAQTYWQPCPMNATELGSILVRHESEAGRVGLAYSIVDSSLHKAIGWIVLRPPITTTVKVNATRPLVSCMLFLTTAQRLEKGCEAMHVISDHAFEALGHDVMDFRAGTLEQDSSAGGGSGLLEILRRQTYVKEGSGESDLYVVNRTYWPMVKVAFAAWLDARVTQ